MKTKTCLVIFLFLSVSVFPALMQDATTEFPAVTVSDTYSIDLTSAVNGNDYRLSVALPVSYYEASGQTYPVLYVLDPLATFLATTEMVRFMHWANEMPEIIVVGIGYPTDDLTETTTPRTRDYYTSQDAFLKFIEAELFPLIDSTYRTDSADRALVGFSYGGELVYHMLSTQPELFKRYIAIDSDIGGLTPLLMRDENLLDKFIGRDVRLFIASSGNEFISASIQQRDYEGLTVTGLSLGDVTHAQALPLSLSTGIMWIYAPADE